MSSTILLVDDDPAVLRGVSGLLRDEGYRTQTASSAAEAFAALTGQGAPALVLLDLRMPDETGLELLARLPRPLPAPVVVLSGEASPSDAAQALKLGATDFVEKPPTPERLLTAVRNALQLDELREERERLRRELARPGHLVGESAAMDELRALIARAGPQGASVLITGETGTGKERVARALHLASGRKGRFVAVNCAAIPSALLEAELFGHERGAFTGAAARRIGRIESAHGGTLLLDEIGELELSLQAKLLRVIESREVERLGATQPVKVDVRLLAATHRDLKVLAAQGRFREDLYYRLDVLQLRVLPLRDRPDDALPLLRAFLAELRPSVELRVAPEAEALLRAYAWPGNVRELRNFVERAALLQDARPGQPLLLDARAVAPLLGQAGPALGQPAPLAGLGLKPYRELVEDHERALLREALARCGGNVAAAARLLKVDRGNLWRRARALSILEGPEDEREP
jgi:DNA-binding NtrC family response regulator